MKIAFSDRDIKYIEKHLECAKPVAKALDLLQGENNTLRNSSTLPIIFKN